MTTMIDVFRHANAARHATDKLRPLSDKGREQALLRKLALNRPVYDLVLASPALRAISTAALVAGCSESEVSELPELHWEGNDALSAAMDGMFAQLGYAPPSAYDALADGHLIRQQNLAAWTEVWRRITTSGAERILVVGHAVMAPGLGQAAAMGNDEMVAYLDLDLVEVGGYRLTLNRLGNVTNITVFI